MQLFYLSILDKLLMIFREVGLQNSIFRLIGTLFLQLQNYLFQTVDFQCFWNHCLLSLSLSLFLSLSVSLSFSLSLSLSLSANFKSTWVIFCIHYASNFKIFSVRMFFIINTMFFRIKTLALKIERSKVRSPGKTLDITFLSIFTNLTKSLKSKKISPALKKKIPKTFTKTL